MGRNHTQLYLAQFCALLLTLLAALVSAENCQADSLRILTQNMNRLFDDVDDGNNEVRLSSSRFRARVDDAVARFANDFGLPHIIALQEIENLNVLRHIADDLRQRHGAEYRAALIPGNDISSINIGFLVSGDLRISKLEQLFHDQHFSSGNEALFSRPPLLLEVCYRVRCISLLNVHLRSMRGINSSTRGERVSRKRRQQAETIARWSHRFQQKHPQADLLLLGDFNARTPADEHVDITGIVRGEPDNSSTRLKARDLIEPDLVDLTRRIPARQRYSYIFRQQRQQLDYMFANRSLAGRVEQISYSPIDYRYSDHAGLLAWFRW
jgi:endonuclease/exonuclease/phosphatase family metal-dependent hydrolase